MIDFIRGDVRQVAATHIVVDVGGMGLRLQATPATIAELREGETRQFPASLIVREDAWTLYGFADVDERSVFEVLQTVSGVGPRLAQGMLAALRPDALRQIVATEDIAALTQVPGIGKKGAQRLVLELKDKLGAPSIGSSAAREAVGGDPAQTGAWQSQVHAALVGLGWGIRDADAALTAVAEEFGEDADSAEIAVLLRAALQSMGRAVGAR